MPSRNGDVATGMSRARQLGMLTYRGRDELDVRFGKLGPGLERPPVAEYLEHHGRRFAERFPVRTFLLLSEAIDRGSIAESPAALRQALALVTAETIVVGVPGDMLFPWALQEELHRQLQAAGAHSSLWKLDSVYGHDAFLADQERLAELLRGARAFGGAPSTGTRPRFEGVGEEPVREIRIGMVGCGTVGGGLLEMIARQQAAVAERYGVRFRVTRIAVRDLSKARSDRAAGIPLTTHPLDLVSDPEVDVVVEVAGGAAMEPVLAAALASGKPVVTANKALLASKLAELGVLAQRTATPLYCEAAAAAALPILRHLSHRADEVDSLAGILNGTCNFVITRMEQTECSLAERGAGSAVARPGGSRPRRGPERAGCRGEAVDPRLPRVRRLGAARCVHGAGHPRTGPARLRSRRGHGLPHSPDRQGRPRERIARHGGRAAADAGLAPAGVGRGGVQRRLPALRLLWRSQPVRQRRRGAADGDRGPGRSDRPRAGQLGALARASRHSARATRTARRRRRRAGTTCASPAPVTPDWTAGWRASCAGRA